MKTKIKIFHAENTVGTGWSLQQQINAWFEEMGDRITGLSMEVRTTDSWMTITMLYGVMDEE